MCVDWFDPLEMVRILIDVHGSTGLPGVDSLVVHGIAYSVGRHDPDGTSQYCMPLQ